MDSIEKLNAAVTLIEEARGVPLSASCVVHRGEILEILDGARIALPSDLDQAIQIISARDVIVEEARLSAEQMIATSREDVARMVEQTAIVQAARDEAQRILDDARALAEQERAEVEGGTQILATNMAVAAFILGRIQHTLVSDQNPEQSEIYFDLGLGMAQPYNRMVNTLISI